MKLFLILLFFALNILAEESDKLSAKSIYQIDHVWTQHNSKPLNLKELAGLPAVVTMTFTSCPGACPLMVSDIKNFDSQLTKKEKKKIRYYTFSIDPKNDTPVALQNFYKKMHLDKRWTLFTSNDDQVKEMAALLGFSYKDLGDGDFTHSTSLYLLSKDGEILARKERSSDWKEFLDKFKEQIKSK